MRASVGSSSRTIRVRESHSVYDLSRAVTDVHGTRNGHRCGHRMFGRKRSPGRSSSPTGKGKAGGATGDKKTLKSAEIKELVRTSVFDQGDINALNEVYHRHTTGENSTIPIERMRDIPETSVFPLFQRVVQMKNTDLSGDIDFAEFVQAMSSLSPRAVSRWRGVVIALVSTR